jgi:hypothetical protein
MAGGIMQVLLLERHDWETSGSEHQIQIPKAAFSEFFGSVGPVNVMVYQPPNTATPVQRKILLSHYAESDTYRINWMTDLGLLGHAVVVFEETGQEVPYNVWWFTDAEATTILARPFSWEQAKASQYGPGRFWAIVPAPGPRVP